MPDRCVENWRCLRRGSIAIVRPDSGRPLFKRRCRRIDLFVKRPSVNVQWVRKNGHRPERGKWIFGTASRVPRSGSFSLLLALSFNLVAHLHRRVLTRGTLQQAFPRAFHQPARKFRATLIYLGRDRLHDTYFFFSFFGFSGPLSPFFAQSVLLSSVRGLRQ